MSEEEKTKVTLREVIGSILWAGLGVQSSRRHTRDFTHGSARQFVIAGLIGTILFILVIYGVVKLILLASGG